MMTWQISSGSDCFCFRIDRFDQNKPKTPILSVLERVGIFQFFLEEINFAIKKVDLILITYSLFNVFTSNR
jgi:hypothetical protein